MVVPLGLRDYRTIYAELYYLPSSVNQSYILLSKCCITRAVINTFLRDVWVLSSLCKLDFNITLHYITIKTLPLKHKLTGSFCGMYRYKLLNFLSDLHIPRLPRQCEWVVASTMWVSSSLENLLMLRILNGEVAQWLGHRIADRKVSSSSPALPTVLRVRDISNLKSFEQWTARATTYKLPC